MAQALRMTSQKLLLFAFEVDRRIMSKIWEFHGDLNRDELIWNAQPRLMHFKKVKLLNRTFILSP